MKTKFNHSDLYFPFINRSRLQHPFSRWTWASRYQNVSILDFIGTKVDGGDGGNWSCRRAKLQSNRRQQTDTCL